MKSPAFRFAPFAAISLSLAAGWGSAQAAIVTTLPTSALDANTTFSFSSTASGAMSLLGISAKALGTSTNVDGNAWSFNMPVTEVTISTSLLPLSISPVSGKATGAALGINGASGSLILANFALDFQRNVMTGDLITSAGTTKGVDLYNFHVADGLSLSTSGGLSLKMSMDQMYLTSTARASFVSALKLPSFTDAVMAQLDFGQMMVEISPALRLGVSGKAFTGTVAVPEAPSLAMMVLGMLGVAWVSRRSQRR